MLPHLYCSGFEHKHEYVSYVAQDFPRIVDAYSSSIRSDRTVSVNNATNIVSYKFLWNITDFFLRAFSLSDSQFIKRLCYRFVAYLYLA